MWGRCCVGAPGRSTPCCSTWTSGPAAFTASDNASLYGDRGLAVTRAALKPTACFAVWSSGRSTIRAAPPLRGLRRDVERVRGRLKKGGPKHTIFIGTVPLVRPRRLIRIDDDPPTVSIV